MAEVVVDGQVVERANEFRGIVFADAWPLALDRPYCRPAETPFPAQCHQQANAAAQGQLEITRQMITVDEGSGRMTDMKGFCL